MKNDDLSPKSDGLLFNPADFVGKLAASLHELTEKKPELVSQPVTPVAAKPIPALSAGTLTPAANKPAVYYPRARADGSARTARSRAKKKCDGKVLIECWASKSVAVRLSARSKSAGISRTNLVAAILERAVRGDVAGQNSESGKNTPPRFGDPVR